LLLHVILLEGNLWCWIRWSISRTQTRT